MNATNLGKHFTAEHKLHLCLAMPHRRPIKQYTEFGEFIKEWRSINEAARETKTERRNIRLCCQGIRNHANNYEWKYAS